MKYWFFSKSTKKGIESWVSITNDSTQLFITQLQSLKVHLHYTGPNEFLVGV